MPHMADEPAETALVLRPASAIFASPTADANNAVMEEASKPVFGGVIMEQDLGDFTRYRQERSRYSREHTAQLQAKNRRKRYLELHPEYFDDDSLELANPTLHYYLVRRFQTPAEREAEGRRKSASELMTTTLWRAEVNRENQNNPVQHTLFTRNVGKDDAPISKEEAKAWWTDEMTQRFLNGEDQDFDYNKVDGNDKYDDPEEERDAQDAYFDSMGSDFDSDGEGKEKVLTGETGIQDY